VAIIGILAAIAIPMYNANVNKAKMQEATDTLGAVKDEVANYASDTGAPPPSLNEANILTILGVACPQSNGPAGGRKWIYSCVDNTNLGANDGTYDVLATAGAAGDIGSVLANNWVACQGDWIAAQGVFIRWNWTAQTAQMRQWVPK
jgi:type II secretory pathway pseudopilin PulG